MKDEERHPLMKEERTKVAPDGHESGTKTETLQESATPESESLGGFYSTRSSMKDSQREKAGSKKSVISNDKGDIMVLDTLQESCTAVEESDVDTEHQKGNGCTKGSKDETDYEREKEGKKSFRGKLVHTPTRSLISHLDDHTIRGEGHFLKQIEAYKNKRLERLCICPVTKWILFKERLNRLNSVITRIERCLWILYCPPLCYILPRIAFWPPPNEYFFYMDNGPPRIRKEVEGHQEAIEIAERKKKFAKVYRADKKAWLQTGWRIGHQHPCADDIDDVEGFIVRTIKKNYIACIRIPTESRHSRYSIIYSHPNASDLSDHLLGVPNLIDIARFYKSDVYAYDYSGFGISSGHASESNQKADIRAIYDHVLNDRGVQPERIILMGYSIGCFASVHLACTIPQPPAGIILQAPPTSVLRVLLWDRACFKKPFSNHTCCSDRFSTYDMISEIRVPVLVIHGEDDRKVPIAHGKAVCEKAVNRAAPLWLRATHDNIENCSETWIRIRDFMRNELKSKRLTTKVSQDDEVQ